MAVLRSARVRLTAWYVLLLGITLLAFGIFVNIQVKNTLLSQEDAALQLAADKLLPVISTARTPPTFLKTGSHAQPFQDATTYLNQQFFSAHLVTPTGTVVDSIGDSGALGKNVSFGRPETSGYTIWPSNPGGRLRVYSQRLTAPDGHPVGWLQVAHALDAINGALQTLLVQMLLGIPLVLLLAALGACSWRAASCAPLTRSRGPRRPSAPRTSHAASETSDPPTRLGGWPGPSTRCLTGWKKPSSMNVASLLMPRTSYARRWPRSKGASRSC